jgi:hypothetical protein
MMMTMRRRRRTTTRSMMMMMMTMIMKTIMTKIMILTMTTTQMINDYNDNADNDAFIFYDCTSLTYSPLYKSLLVLASPSAVHSSGLTSA